MRTPDTPRIGGSGGDPSGGRDSGGVGKDRGELRGIIHLIIAHS